MSLRYFLPLHNALIACIFLAAVKEKRHFYQANVVFGVFFYVSVVLEKQL